MEQPVQQQMPNEQQIPQQAPQQPIQQQVRTFPQSGNNRALAMMLYWSGLIGLIMGAIVCDKNTDEFIKHHLNQAVAIFLGYIICSLLAIIVIGYIGMIALFVFQIMATVEAYNGTTNPLPLIGKIKFWK